jgi:hypothetical protein
LFLEAKEQKANLFDVKEKYAKIPFFGLCVNDEKWFSLLDLLLFPASQNSKDCEKGKAH